MERTLRGDEDRTVEAGHPADIGAEWELTDAAFIDEFAEQEGLHRVKYDSRQGSPSFTVITLVSKITGKNPLKLDTLHESIDVEALDALFAADGSSVGQLTFRYSGCEITVRTGGVVEMVAR